MSDPGDVVEAEAFAAEIESGRFRVLVEVRCLAAFDLVATIHATPQGDALRIAPLPSPSASSTATDSTRTFPGHHG